MKRISYIAICCFLLLAITRPLFAGEVIDSVVATVNHRPILQSDWEEAVRFEAFMQQKPLSQITQSDQVLALHRLIDRELLKEQMGKSEHVEPSDEELQQDLNKLRAQLPNGSNDAQWHKLLASYDLTKEAVKEHLRTEFQVMNFVEVRLRPNVHITGDEIETYYKDQLLPDLAKNGGKPIPLDDVEPRIKELLTQQRMDELLDVWLHNLRQQAEINSTVAVPGINEPDPAKASGMN